MDTSTPQQGTSSSQYSGQVSLPNDGQVLTMNEPDTQASSLSSATATSPATTDQSPQHPNASTVPVPTNQSSVASQSSAPTQDSTQKTVDLSKPQGKTQPAATAPTSTTHPSVQKASVFHQVAEALAGGPRYKYTVDAYGNMQKQALPVSNAHLGMALALEALSGAAAGLSQTGPGATGKAAAVGFAQGEQRRQQEEQTAKNAATEDYSRRAQVAETNMRMYSVARDIGRKDEQANDAYISQYKDLATKLQTEFPNAIKGIAKYSDFGKYNVTIDNAIPYMRVPRLDKDGKQVVDEKGVPQSDINYLILDPSLKSDGLLNDKDLATAKEMGMPWANNKLVGNAPMTLMMALNLKSKIAQWNVAKTDFANFQETLGNAVDSSSNNANLTVPPIKDEKVAQIAQSAATKYNVPQALVNAIILQESSGNANTPDSPTGAKGLMQLTSGTDKDMGVQDAHDPAQNVDGGVKYLSQLLNTYKDPKLAAAAYYSGPAAIDTKGNIVDTGQHTAADTEKYVKSVSNLAGIGRQLTDTEKKSAAKPLPSMADFAKDNLTFPSDVEKFMGALNGTDGNYGKALQHLQATGQGESANTISSYLGGPTNITKHDDYVTAQAEQRKQDIKDQSANNKAQFKQNLDDAHTRTMESYTKMPDSFTSVPNILNMDWRDAAKALKAQGVVVPPQFSSLFGVAKYKINPNTFFPKVWTKGSPDEMDSQTAKTFVTQFLNPYQSDGQGGYDDAKFGNAAKALFEVQSGNSKNGASIQNAGTAAQHLELLGPAGDALGNGDLPMLNKIALQFGTQTGADPQKVYNAIVHIATQEVAKVAAGGTVPYKEAIEKSDQDLIDASSPAQRQGVIKNLVGLMAGRLGPIDENFYSARQEHLPNVSKKATEIFQKYGYETPWTNNQSSGNQNNPTQTNGNNNQQTQPQPPVQGATPGYLNGKIVGWKLPNGQTVPANYQPQPPQSVQNIFKPVPVR